jgi:prepilin-type N-terminal cleavage/methylation domain-containing protein
MMPGSEQTQDRNHGRRGFTLIELLTVVGIIMVLAGLILSGLNVARARASVVRARRDIAQLVTGWNAYFADYGRFPTVSGNSVTNGLIVTGRDVVQILRGRENYNSQNPRRVTYMDFHVNTTQFPDPWGNLYRIAWDEEPYDVKISVRGESLRMSLVVWSAGEDGADDTEDDVLSWRQSQ